MLLPFIKNHSRLRAIPVARNKLAIFSYTFSVDGKVVESACVKLLRRKIVKNEFDFVKNVKYFLSLRHFSAALPLC